jgi:chromosome segregation ATPase
MSDTPETDAVWKGADTIKQVMTSRRLERERNDARHEIEGWSNKWDFAVEMAVKAENERDEAKAELARLTSKLGDMYDANIALGKERDALLKDLEFRRDLFKVQEEQLNEVRRERDEARDKAVKAWEENLRLDSVNRRLQMDLEDLLEKAVLNDE